ncbi:hypothetical protein P152DRAFT_509776 [Eremomyces bilateralis CBS 781.70]|uniref:Uncharacterized protein n=1 Tax=Eremomyces bilateralis CBS 781.70 TaxID=1392243 RepID=A0A6G1FS84_9PEZI|nr:uncharacterized protein P152DRAFT_509776 [Eremomyces bilateralis CBS 781.70]KAF1808532.1 hypothetical protein P152DRAFT_509776 [Eremomyces bilateralis CBS 781.70]
MYRASQLINTMTTVTGKAIAVAYVTKTDVWERPFLHQSTQDEFVEVAEKYKDDLKPETAKVAMKEAEHPSTNDPTQHYSAFELDKDGNVIASKHYYK